MRAFLERLGRYLPATIGLALPLLFIPFAVDSYILPRASVVIAGACLGVGIALATSAGAGLGALRLPLIAAALAALLAFATSTNWSLSLAGAYTRYESLPVRLGYLGLLALPVWLLRKESDRDWLVAAFVLGAAIACLEAVVQWFLLNVAQTIDYRPDGNLGNANLLGAVIAMAMPLAIVRALRNDLFVVAWWGAVAVLVAGLAASTSRSGALGALAACLVLVVFALRGRAAQIGALVAAAVVAVVLLAIVVSPLGVLNDDPARSRIQLWPDALRMIAARLLTGWGPDTTGLVFGRFLSADWSPGVTFDRAHSGPLDIAAMLGVIGLAALTWVLLAWVRGVWKWRFTDSVAALASACAGYTVWVAFNFDWAPATGMFWLLAGAAWSGVRMAAAQPVPAAVRASPKWVAPVRSLAAAGLGLAFIGLAVLPVLADAWYFQGRADLSVTVDPLQSRYHWARGQELEGNGQVKEAAAEFRRAADLGETEPQLYVDLGDADAELGDTAQARRDYQRALVIDPFFAPAKQRLANLRGLS